MKKQVLFLLFLAITTYAQQERVAIIQTLDNNDSISFQSLLYLTDKLRETAVKILPKERYGVMTTESIIAFLGSQERAVKACNESSCLAELGRMVSADYVAQGRIGRFGKDLTIKVELYSVKSGNLIGSFTGDSKNIYGLRDIINENAPDLFKNMLATTPPPKLVAPPEAPTPPPPRPDTLPAPKETPPEEPEAPIAEENEEEGEYDYTYHIQKLIDQGIKKNKEEIQEKSSHISLVESELLYEKNKKVGALGLAALNVLPGFGLGSYIQGDILSGVTQSVLEVTAIISVNLGSKYNSDYYNGICSGTCEKLRKKSDTFYNIAAYIFITNFAIGLIRPFYYQFIYNNALKKALYPNEYLSLSIDPLIIPRDGTPAVGLAFNVRY